MDSPDALDRWLGSKRWLPKLHAARLPVPSPRGRAFDPFTGSGAIALHYLSLGHRVVMGDTNPRLIGAYARLRAGTPELYDRLVELAEEHAIARLRGVTGGKEHFLAARSRLNASDPTSTESAALFLFVLRSCFNGVYRVNRRGACNTTYGEPATGKDLVRRAELEAIGALLQRADLVCADFEEVCRRARRGDACYFDPPYVGDRDTKPAFVSYAAGGFRQADRLRLSTLLRDLDRRRVRWLLSDAACSGAASSYGLWRVTEVKVQRSASAKSEGRGLAPELLVSND